MAVAGSLQLSLSLGIYGNHHRIKQFKCARGRGNQHLLAATNLSSFVSRQDPWSSQLSTSVSRPVCSPYRYNYLRCHSFLFLGQNVPVPSVKTATLALTNALQESPLATKLVPAVGIIAFALWGLRPLMQFSIKIFLHKSESSWKKSTANYVMTSYLQPILLWMAAILVCRALDPVVLPTEASRLVKQRLLNFVKSLSTVLAFAYCLSSVVQQSQKYFMETNDTSDARNMGFQFAGKAIYTAVWVAAVSLFMELLGFSTQRWLTAGGLGTVLLTLAGREIFTNFLSSAMIHATRPFVLNEWIQTKIEGYEVSGTIEHVGWWSPTVIRGEDREAVHIPNHKFTVNVVRNLSQKTHWRIKTHLAVSHLDASKINSIIADMRKVLAKNPQVEQQKLHRRVFLENVNPENQALVILISCFVKTSHHEEYLRVKEVILLDLLRVIRHHRARLATPIRTIHKFYNEPDLESMSFSDSCFTRGGPAAKRPVLLIEPSYKINGEDKSKSQARTMPTGEVLESQSIDQSIIDPKVDSKVRGSSTPELNANETSKTGDKAEDKLSETSSSESAEQNKASVASKLDPKSDDNATPNSTSRTKPNIENNATEAKHADVKTTGSPASANALRNSESTQLKPNAETQGGSVAGSQSRDMDKTTNSEPSKSTSQVLEDNIVLGVALDGSKRTLPIEEKLDSSSTQQEPKELAGQRTGSSAGDEDGKEI